jgi:hypothetical protein
MRRLSLVVAEVERAAAVDRLAGVVGVAVAPSARA